MVKLRMADHRLSLGGWSVPLISQAWTTISRASKPMNGESTAGSNGATSALAVSQPAEVGDDAIADNQESDNTVTSSSVPGSPTANATSIKTSKSNIVELAASITAATGKFDAYVKGMGGPPLGFDVDSLLKIPKLPDEIKKARELVVQATQELGDLVKGPEESLRWLAWDHNDALSLQAISHYKIAKSFPIDEKATFNQIATATGLEEVNVRRFMRHAMTNRIFKEVSPGVVAHTAASRLLAEDQPIDDWVGFCLDDMFPAAGQTIKAVDLHPSALEPTQTGFCMANNTTDVESMFQTFDKSPLRAKRMGGAMASLTGGEGYEVSYLLDHYDWAAIDAISGTVVDIGGSHGFVCVDLAQRFKNMTFVVQDLHKTIASAPQLDTDIRDRITFQAHDFFQKQPVKDADVYLFRWIFHNHSDKYALVILRALIPALKKGARILINDHCLPEPNTESLWDEKIIRTMDLVMLTLLNAQERTENDFRSLFARADKGFRFVGVKRPSGCRMSMVEAAWEGAGYNGHDDTSAVVNNGV